MCVLETERLLFRQLTLQDLEALAALYADPEVMSFLGGVRSREQTEAQVRNQIQCYATLGYGLWATIDKATQRCIGRCGFLAQYVDGQQEMEVAYTLARSYWGQGLATEAARAIIAYGFRQYHRTRFIALIAHDNIASQRVAEKSGMHYWRDAVVKGFPCRVYTVYHE